MGNRKYLKIQAKQKRRRSDPVLETDGSAYLKVSDYSAVASLRGAAGSIGRNLTWTQLCAIAYEDRAYKAGSNS